MDTYEKGFKKIKIAGYMLVASSVFTIIISNISSFGQDILTEFIRLSLTVLLSYFLIKGSKVARAITGVLLILAMLLLILSLAYIMVNPLMGIINLALIVFYGYMVNIVIFDASVKEYFLKVNGGEATE